MTLVRPPPRGVDRLGEGMTLADFDDLGHANNFNLIRLLAALTVLLSHSVSLTGAEQPMVPGTSLPFSRIALDVFFLTSGFLVTKSLFVRQDVVDFIVARALRIYPGLIVMTLITILVAGAFGTPGFFSDPATHRYGLSTAFLFVDKLVVYDLPGIFVANPFPNAVNGSLWTLPYELRMYLLLATAWATFALAGAWHLRLVATSVVSMAVLTAVLKVTRPESFTVGFAFMFFGGASYYVLRRHVPIRTRLAWVAVGLMVASAPVAPVFAVAYHLLVGYVLFALGYLPRLWRPVDDYSYGAYIYAFPLQQTAVMLLPGAHPWLISALVTPIVIGVAALSWHLIEKPSVALKVRFVRWRAARRAR